MSCLPLNCCIMKKSRKALRQRTRGGSSYSRNSSVGGVDNLEKGCSLGAGFISAGSATVILGRGARGRRPWVRGALGGGTESSGLDGATAAAFMIQTFQIVPGALQTGNGSPALADRSGSGQRGVFHAGPHAGSFPGKQSGLSRQSFFLPVHTPGTPFP